MSGQGRRNSAVALGHVIRRLRQEAGLTQRELAETTGYKAALVISKIERGQMKPVEKKLVHIARGLNVSISELTRQVALESLAQAQDSDNKDEAASSHPATPQEGGNDGLARTVRSAVFGKVAEDNRRRLAKIGDEVEFRRRNSETIMVRLQQAQDLTKVRVLDPFFEKAPLVKGMQPLPDRPMAGRDSALLVPTRDERIKLRAQILQAIEFAGATAGLATGARAAFLTFSASAAFATASTGTAIAGLTGGAASSATFAALGGGSLAAGGAGVAGGTLVLTGIVGFPVLLAAGAVLTYKGRQFRRQAEADAERLTAAEQALEDAREPLDTVWSWLERECKILETAQSQGGAKVNWLESVTTPVEWAELDAAKQTQLSELLSLVVAVLTLLSLPLFVILEPEATDPAGLDQIRQWNEQVLADAEAQLGVLRALDVLLDHDPAERGV